MKNLILQIKRLNVFYQKKHILKDITFEVDKGVFLAVLGHNGSGKTTLLKSIVGLYPATGSILFKGVDIISKPVNERVKLGIGYIMQEIPVYTGISVFDYVKNILDFVGKFDLKKIEYYFDLFGLDWITYRNRKFNHELSGGEKKKIEIITSFLMDKELYLLDEVEASLDVNSRKVLIKILKKMSSEGKSFIIVSHMKDMISIAKTGILLCNGQVERYGLLKEVLKKYEEVCKKCTNKFFLKNDYTNIGQS